MQEKAEDTSTSFDSALKTHIISLRSTYMVGTMPASSMENCAKHRSATTCELQAQSTKDEEPKSRAMIFRSLHIQGDQDQSMLPRTTLFLRTIHSSAERSFSLRLSTSDRLWSSYDLTISPETDRKLSYTLTLELQRLRR